MQMKHVIPETVVQFFPPLCLSSLMSRDRIAARTARDVRAGAVAAVTNGWGCITRVTHWESRGDRETSGAFHDDGKHYKIFPRQNVLIFIINIFSS